MNQNYQLCSPWCVWLGFLSEEQGTKAGYNDTLKKVHTIKTYNDLIYYWQQSKLKNLQQYFVCQNNATSNNLNKYEIDGKNRSINAVNYFREGINPTWEDENNKFGGRLIFQIDKEIENFQEVYQWLVFYFLGESESSAEEINGIRFISHKPNAPFKFHYRVEVWTKFNQSEQNKVKELKDTFVQDFFKSFLENTNSFKNFKPNFRNNQEEEDKDKKEGQNKQTKN